jgi:hypothetical protein
VEALIARHIHVAWNSPLAWLQCERIAAALDRRAEAICMRDTDCDLASVIFVRSDAGIRGIADLKGKRVAVGASDSPQATLIPLNFLAEHGARAGQRLRGGSVRQAVRQSTEITSAASATPPGHCFAGMLTRHAASMEITSCSHRKGPCPPAGRASSPKRRRTIIATSRCSTARRSNRWRDSVSCCSVMSYADPEVRLLLDMEGLKQWRVGRTEGYAALDAALRRFGTVDEFVRTAVSDCK